MSRRERGSESRRHRSGFDREPRFMKWVFCFRTKHDLDQKNRRRLQDALPLETPSGPDSAKVESGGVSKETEQKPNEHGEGSKHSSKPTEVPWSRAVDTVSSEAKHDERGNAGQVGRSFGRRSATERRFRDSKDDRGERTENKAATYDSRQRDEKPRGKGDDKSVWGHDGFLKMEAEPPPPVRKRPAFREKKIPVETDNPDKANCYDIIDDYGDDQFETTSPKKLDAYLEKILSKKKRFSGKELLPLIVEALNNELELKFVENNLFTVLGFCLQFIIKGPSTERQLALNALGLLAMTIDNEEDARELYRSSLAVLSETLNSGTETLKILDSLAMITFFCANYSNETEEPMKIIWTFLDADSDNEVARKHSSAVLAAAISALVFSAHNHGDMETQRRTLARECTLNTSINVEVLDFTDILIVCFLHECGGSIIEAISYFTNVLEEGDESVHVAAAEALGPDIRN
ncbi:hypothetical protein NC652_024234 [Populus alba x Populus x berolinensis]|nr:hypothetical protein NC652_024234 [Populus alba x Populus x berolinensis]